MNPWLWLVIVSALSVAVYFLGFFDLLPF
jgi:hypothetical protein